MLSVPPLKSKRAHPLESSYSQDFLRHMKITAQLSGVFPPDPDLTSPTQELFEQFYEVSRESNDAERDLLSLVARVDGEIIDAWCKWSSRNTDRTHCSFDLLVALKHFRLRAIRHLKQEVKNELNRMQDPRSPCRRFRLYRYKTPKPYLRH